MASGEDDLAFKARVRSALYDSGNTISYGALAGVLNVAGPGSIARLTSALEALMQDDMAAGRPFIAALCEGRLSNGMPALGFFQMATALGRYSGPTSGPDAVAFVTEQRALLRGGTGVNPFTR